MVEVEVVVVAMVVEEMLRMQAGMEVILVVVVVLATVAIQVMAVVVKVIVVMQVVAVVVVEVIVVMQVAVEVVVVVVLVERAGERGNVRCGGRAESSVSLALVRRGPRRSLPPILPRQTHIYTPSTRDPRQKSVY